MKIDCSDHSFCQKTCGLVGIGNYCHKNNDKLKMNIILLYFAKKMCKTSCYDANLLACCHGF